MRAAAARNFVELDVAGHERGHHYVGVTSRFRRGIGWHAAALLEFPHPVRVDVMPAHGEALGHEILTQSRSHQSEPDEPDGFDHDGDSETARGAKRVLLRDWATYLISGFPTFSTSPLGRAAVCAASRTARGTTVCGSAPPPGDMPLRTQPGSMAFTKTPLPFSSAAIV